MKHLFEYEEHVKGEYVTFHNRSGESFWGDQGAGVFVICKKTKRCLLGRRSEYVNEPGDWCMFGGMVDSTADDIEETAKRELAEESGYDGDVQLIPAYVFTSKGGGFRYYNFIGLVNKEYEPVLDWENDDHQWLTFDELKHIQPKHFGLDALLNDQASMRIIKKYMK